ncbi:hypothetical protein [Burkholderia ubonensis]|nr:hypothetical protein [Burkholderia ubonensis]
MVPRLVSLEVHARRHAEPDRAIVMRSALAIEPFERGPVMNWLSEYFAQRTRSLFLSMWAYPPLVLGPDGPVAPPAYCLPYPGVRLVLTPGDKVRRGELTEDLPARYDAAGLLTAGAGGPGERGDATAFFRTITIYAPSAFNPDFLVTINGIYMFVPVFSRDGAPGFSGTCRAQEKDLDAAERMELPWTFQGYLSI